MVRTKVRRDMRYGGAKPTNVAFWESSLYVTEVEKGRVMRLDIGARGETVFGLA